MLSLNLEQRASLAAFAAAFPFEEVLLGRILEEEFGEVVVDRWPEPRAAMLSGVETAFLVGDASVEDAPALVQAAVANGTTLMLHPAADWEALLIQSFGPDRVRKADWTALDGSSMSLDEVLALKTTLPAECTCRRMTAEDARRLVAEDAIVIGPWWSSPEDFFARGFGYVVEGEDGGLLASIHTARIRGKRMRVFIQTQRDARRKGLAMAMTAHFIEFCRLNGGYRSWWNAINPDAIALAQSLGFSTVGTFQTWHVRGTRARPPRPR